MDRGEQRLRLCLAKAPDDCSSQLLGCLPRACQYGDLRQRCAVLHTPHHAFDECGRLARAGPAKHTRDTRNGLTHTTLDDIELVVRHGLRRQ